MGNQKKALFLVDGVHKAENSAAAVRELCARHGALPVSFLWIGGTEKMKDRASFSKIFEDTFGVSVEFPESSSPPGIMKGIRKILSQDSEIKAVIQVSGAPQVTRDKLCKYASAAAACAAEYIAGTAVLKEYRVGSRHEKPSIGIYAVDKRAGKTAFGSYIGSLLCGIRGVGGDFKPVIITHSRGGPDSPPLIDIHGKKLSAPAEELSREQILSSRFRPDYLGRLLEFGLHGASDVFEDALIISAYLDEAEKKKMEVPYISLIGCRRAGSGFFNEFAVSNAAEGVEKANAAPADLIIHEGSGAEHPPVEVDTVIFLIPADTDPRILEDFPGLEKASLFIFANCQEETAAPENLARARDILSLRSPDAMFSYTRFEPEAVGVSREELRGKKAAFFTTAPGYILERISGVIERKYGCILVSSSNSLDNDSEMRKTIDALSRKCDLMLFEIKARGVEGAAYAEKNYSIPYRYINNIPVEVDSNFALLDDSSSLDASILSSARLARSLFRGN